MGKKGQADRKTFRSRAEIEKKFLPDYRNERLREERSRQPETFGTGLANDLLDGIRQQLKK